jgi:uracil-DNA glycosylase
MGGGSGACGAEADTLGAVDPETLNRLVKQHAETSRLLGVDFVPAYRSTRGTALPSAAANPGPSVPAPAPRAPEPVIARAGRRDAAESTRCLDELRARYERDAPHRQFVTAHTNIVFGEGDSCARLMFIGEAPGAEEDRTGRPFVGRAGQLLEKMITAMGLSRSQVYIANVLKTRPPDNATPTTEEIRLCAPYLFEQIGIIGPEVIVALGLPATRALLDTAESMSRLRGRWASFRLPAPFQGEVPVMPTYHPAFLLRSYTPENRAKVWSDLQQVMGRLGLTARGPAPTV